MSWLEHRLILIIGILLNFPAIIHLAWRLTIWQIEPEDAASMPLFQKEMLDLDERIWTWNGYWEYPEE